MRSCPRRQSPTPRPGLCWLVDPTTSLLAPLLCMQELFALSLICKGLRPMWRQLCHMNRRLNNEVVVDLLSSGTYQAEAIDIDMSTIKGPSLYIRHASNRTIAQGKSALWCAGSALLGLLEAIECQT